jgi:formylglycine-generating enzyme required for sulfatase activity
MTNKARLIDLANQLVNEPVQAESSAADGDQGGDATPPSPPRSDPPEPVKTGYRAFVLGGLSIGSMLAISSLFDDAQQRGAVDASGQAPATAAVSVAREKPVPAASPVVVAEQSRQAASGMPEKPVAQPVAAAVAPSRPAAADDAEQALAAAPAEPTAAATEPTIADEASVGIVGQPQLTHYTNALGIDFLRIPQGCMSKADGASACVNQDFFLARTEVTQGQWQALMGENPSRFQGEEHPVENVSWLDAQGFIDRLNQREGGTHYRLPSGLEWEYAARAEGPGRLVSCKPMHGACTTCKAMSLNGSAWRNQTATCGLFVVVAGTQRRRCSIRLSTTRCRRICGAAVSVSGFSGNPDMRQATVRGRGSLRRLPPRRRSSPSPRWSAFARAPVMPPGPAKVPAGRYRRDAPADRCNSDRHAAE